MSRPIMLMTAGTLLAACAVAPGELSCADLAQARADGQFERESALLEQQEQGLPDKSEVQRIFIAMDAQAYRVEVYDECLRRQGPARQEN
ncbi:MAG: hypothetical protein KAT39_11180 [Alphaproteobacteria bacterium]|nr:hypothetical protein [Alphaproteobacteria bacterium]